MRPGLLWTLFFVFVPLSFATIGGGQSIVPGVHREVVELNGWLGETQFVTDFALSRLAPGPGSLLITLIGWQVGGVWGALVASAAIFLPTSLLLYGVAHLWRRQQGRAWQRAVERGLAPVAAGLMLAASVTVLQAAGGGWRAWVVAAVATVLLTATRLSPFLLLAAGAAVFVLTT